jgi:hypothetical protein
VFGIKVAFYILIVFCVHCISFLLLYRKGVRWLPPPFQPQSDVGFGATVGSGCKVGAGAHVAAGAAVADAVALFRNGPDGEQATGLAPRALEVRIRAEGFRHIAQAGWKAHNAPPSHFFFARVVLPV